MPGGDDDVVDLGHLGELLGDLDELVALAADADHRHLVEAELERVGDADDLEDAALDEPVGAGADRRLGDAELGGDLGERPAAVGLEVLDDPLVERRDLVGARARSRAGCADCGLAGSWPGMLARVRAVPSALPAAADADRVSRDRAPRGPAHGRGSRRS